MANIVSYTKAAIDTLLTAAKVRANHTGTQSADTLTDGTTNKAFLATERTKLAGVATGATANSTDATLLARANHTGTQAAATITGLATVATSGAYADLSGKPAAVVDASDTVKGIVELATTTEAATGTDTARAVTPAGVATALAAYPAVLLYSGSAYPVRPALPAGAATYRGPVEPTDANSADSGWLVGDAWEDTSGA